jgi:hypothetical protein
VTSDRDSARAREVSDLDIPPVLLSVPSSSDGRTRPPFIPALSSSIICSLELLAVSFIEDRTSALLRPVRLEIALTSIDVVLECPFGRLDAEEEGF